MLISRLTFNLLQAVVRTNRRTLFICPSWKIHNTKSNCYAEIPTCCRMIPPTALVMLAEGAEEQEAITAVNILRRGNIKVTIGGVCGPDAVKCRSGTNICPDKSLQDAAAEGPYGAVILPGGVVGAMMLCESSLVGKVLNDQEKSGGLICAICAAPTALKKHNIGKGKNITSYPAMAKELRAGNSYVYHDDVPVVVDGNLITSRGPATAYIFALTILENLVGKTIAGEVAEAMLYKY